MRMYINYGWGGLSEHVPSEDPQSALDRAIAKGDAFVNYADLCKVRDAAEAGGLRRGLALAVETIRGEWGPYDRPYAYDVANHLEDNVAAESVSS